MPATAGRVRMPANNRVHSSAALQTHGIWQSAIGYDPYAPEQKEAPKDDVGPTEKGGDNAYDSFQGLLALARLTGSNASEARGSCKKCNRVGHLTFQCRNFLTAKEEIVGSMEPNGDMMVMPEGVAGEGEEDEDESDLSESDLDSEMERALAKAVGGYNRPSEVMKDKKAGEKGKGSERLSRKRRRREEEEDSIDSESEESSGEERSRRRKQRKSSSRSRNRRSKKSSRKSRTETRDDFDDSSSESEDEPRRKKRNDRERGRKKSKKVDSDDSVESEEGRERRDRRKKKGKERSSSSKKDKDRRKKIVHSGNEESE